MDGKLTLRATLDKPALGAAKLADLRGPTPPGSPDPSLQKTAAFRGDARLGKRLSIEETDPPLADVLTRLHEATGVPLALDPALARHDPQFGAWQLRDVPAWQFMSIVADHQLDEGRWVKDGAATA